MDDSIGKKNSKHQRQYESHNVILSLLQYNPVSSEQSEPYKEHINFMQKDEDYYIDDAENKRKSKHIRKY